MQEIYFAGGCFWGTEHFFKQVQGVTATETGFANGSPDLPAPTYEQVYTDATGYAETVRVCYDESAVSLAFLVQMFFAAIDPLSLNRQGHDTGTRYRTGVYYTSPEQKAVIEAVFAEQQRKYNEPIQVELLPLQNYYPADEYHQDYLDKHPDGYCHLCLSGRGSNAAVKCLNNKRTQTIYQNENQYSSCSPCRSAGRLHLCPARVGQHRSVVVLQSGVRRAGRINDTGYIACVAG